MGLFSFLRDLSSAQGTRNAMQKSYSKHRRTLDSQRLPSGTSLHDAALYGALASRYKVSGVAPDTIEPFIWLELLPFRFLPQHLGSEALAEYVVWKEKETNHEARMSWLSQQVLTGARAAMKEDPEMVRQAYALGGDPQHSSPWTSLTPKDQL